MTKPFGKENVYEDKTFLPTTMAKQIPNACVTSIMEYANNKVFGGTVNEGAYIIIHKHIIQIL